MRHRATSRSRPLAVAAAAAGPVVLALAPAVLAHGGVVPPEPTPGGLLTSWSFDPHVQLAIIIAAVLYVVAVRRVDRAHPSNRVPLSRTVAWLGGLVALEIALQSGLALYDTTLFSYHMVQHLLLTMVAAPLLVLGAPVTLLLRVSSAETRKRWILPVLHSRVVGFVSHPVVAWLTFTAVMWVSHLTALFDVALENPPIHELEHAIYLGAAVLFWWPVIGPDPSPHRMTFPAKLLYLFLQMPQNTFLALTIYSATEALYPHYVTTVRSWGPTPLADQQAAGAIMWLSGDLIFIVAMLGILLSWWRAEERTAVRDDRRVDAERAAIREREAVLAARLASERGDGGPPASG